MILDVEFGERLRASEKASTQRIAIYLADKNRFQEPVHDLGTWIGRVVNLLTDINEGCTRLPSAFGTWKDKDGTILEHAIIVYSYIRYPERFVERLDEIVALVHRFGREARQKAVMVELSGGDYGSYFSRAYFVKEEDYVDFSPPEGKSASPAESAR